MACRCDGYYDEPRTQVIQGVSRKLYRKLLTEANDVTRLLCAAESLLTPEQLAKKAKILKLKRELNSLEKAS